MVTILLLERNQGSQDRESVASWMNQPEPTEEPRANKKNPRACAHFLIYPLHFSKQNDSDVI